MSRGFCLIRKLAKRKLVEVVVYIHFVVNERCLAARYNCFVYAIVSTVGMKKVVVLQ